MQAPGNMEPRGSRHREGSSEAPEASALDLHIPVSSGDTYTL